jgi:hypothetical protein
MTQRESREAIARKRIKWVREILGRGCNKEGVESAVWTMLGYQRPYENEESMNKTKKAIARAAKALRRWNATLTDPKLPTSVGKLLPTSLAELRKLQEKLERWGDASLGRPERTTFHLRRRAAQVAGYLLQAHNLPLNTTRGGQYHRVAAAIYGDQDADLFNHVRFYHDHQLFEEYYDDE